jgi:hypothetical protein
LVESTRIVAAIWTGGAIKEASRREIEHPDDTHDREATPGSLSAWLRIFTLVFLRVIKTKGGAIDRLGAKTSPELPRFHPGFCVGLAKLREVIEKVIRESRSCPAE